jgi:hypothetical protein
MKDNGLMLGLFFIALAVILTSFVPSVAILVEGDSKLEGDVNITGNLQANNYFSSDGTEGWTGNCSGTIEVKNGLVVGCS